MFIWPRVLKISRREIAAYLAAQKFRILYLNVCNSESPKTCFCKHVVELIFRLKHILCSCVSSLPVVQYEQVGFIDVLPLVP